MEPEELGRIERPDSSSVIGKRKVYIVTMVSPLPGAPVPFANVPSSSCTQLLPAGSDCPQRAAVAYSCCQWAGLFQWGDGLLAMCDG